MLSIIRQCNPRNFLTKTVFRLQPSQVLGGSGLHDNWMLPGGDKPELWNNRGELLQQDWRGQDGVEREQLLHIGNDNDHCQSGPISFIMNLWLDRNWKLFLLNKACSCDIMIFESPLDNIGKHVQILPPCV